MADNFELFGDTDSKRDLPELFKRIYYHLYTNSKASRAELIVEDLSLLLLTSLSAEMNGGKTRVQAYLAGKSSANKMLLPVLRESFPELLSSKQLFALDDHSLRLALGEISQLDLSHAPAHALGEAFQALIGPRLRGEKGQFFTPKSLVKAMVHIVDPKPGESVADPACGTGGFLAETHIHQLQKYPRHKLQGELVGVDKDSGLARLSGALLRILSRGRAHVYNFNSLSAVEWEKNARSRPENLFDVILTNPPFGAKIGVRDESVLRTFAFGHVWLQDKGSEHWTQTDELSSSADPQTLFLELCVNALRPGGRLGIILPEGVFGNKQTSYVWDWLREHGSITALLDCPRTTFAPGTDTKTNVLFFTKHRARRSASTTTTRVAVALHCGHDRRGRTNLSDGSKQPDDFPTIATDFHDEKLINNSWRPTQLDGQRYLVPRYYFDRDSPAQTESISRGAEVISLRELVQEGSLSIRKGHEVGSDAYGTGDIPFVRTSDLSNFEISSDPTKAVSERVYEEFRVQQNLRAGDVLMVVDGRYRIGTTALLTERNVRCVAQSHLRIMSILDHERLNSYALLYALNLPSVKLRLRSLVFIQSTLGTLGSRLLELRIPLLVGKGPWSERLARFRATLEQRSELLSELQAMSGPDYEL